MKEKEVKEKEVKEKGVKEKEEIEKKDKRTFQDDNPFSQAHIPLLTWMSYSVETRETTSWTC